MTSLALSLLGVIVFVYVVGPLLLRQKMRIAVRPAIEPVASDGPELPVAVRGFFGEVSSEVRKLGFTPLGRFVDRETVAGVTAYIALFGRHDTKEQAAAMAVFAGSGEARGGRYVVEFHTEFVDGREVDTNNSPGSDALFRVPWKSVCAFPGMADPSQLYQVHRERAREYGGLVRKQVPPASECGEELRQGMMREFKAHADAGFLRLEGREDAYRCTMKGAILGAWGQRWPILSMRRWLARRRARKLLKEMGLPADYRMVDYRREVARWEAEAQVIGVPTTELEGEDADAFDSAVDAQSRVEAVKESPGRECSVCQKPIVDTYYAVDGAVQCERCWMTDEAARKGGSRVGRFAGATALGGLAGVLSAVIYYGVAAITGYEIGWIALIVGLLVGGAVRWGSGRRGGWAFQLLAMFLTYASIATSYGIFAIQEFIEHPELLDQPGMATSAPAGEGDGAAVPTASAPASTQPWGASDDVEPPTLGEFVLALVLLVVWVLVLPVLVSTQAPFTAVFVGIALYEAWKLNKRPDRTTSGPHHVQRAVAGQD